jgi:penicillin-binding protein 1A
MSTSFTIDDEPMRYTGTNLIFLNDTGTWNGETSVQKTFPMSYNVPSVKLYKWLNETIGSSVMKNYLINIGHDASMVENMNEQFAIGCFGYYISPIQMAAAQSVILSKGIYTTPHTITRIEFINSSKEPIVANVPTVRALSEGAAWLTAYLEYIGVNGGTEDDYVGNRRLTAIRRSSYAVYGKTGTMVMTFQLLENGDIHMDLTKTYYIYGEQMITHSHSGWDMTLVDSKIKQPIYHMPMLTLCEMFQQ